MELMRHESIDTTQYYGGRNAKRTMMVLREAYRQALASGGENPELSSLP